ncbi:unnamed protein product [Amoebophrya sp. A120]|nr:unnamed protein product [Amoebophrya sp. A120]|eukprot:GSA120T00006247001.1
MARSGTWFWRVVAALAVVARAKRRHERRDVVSDIKEELAGTPEHEEFRPAVPAAPASDVQHQEQLHPKPPTAPHPGTGTAATGFSLQKLLSPQRLLPQSRKNKPSFLQQFVTAAIGGPGAAQKVSSTSGADADQDSTVEEDSSWTLLNERDVCRCDQCSVLQRFPSEVFSNVNLKCGPTAGSPTGGHEPAFFARGAAAAANTGRASLGPSTGGGSSFSFLASAFSGASTVARDSSECRSMSSRTVLETPVGSYVNLQRHCFYECQPAQGFRASPLNSACVALTETEVATLRPGKDPAFLLVDAEERKQEQQKMLLLASSSSSRKKIAPADVVANAKKTAAETGGESENALADSHATVKKHEAGGGANFGENVAVAFAQMVHEAEAAANEATEAAAETTKTMDAICDEARAAAVGKGKALIASLSTEEKEAAAKAAAYKAKLANTPSAKAKVAMDKAAQPFFDQMTGAQARARDYSTLADQKAGKAVELEKEARDLEKEANQLNKDGDRVGASQTIAVATEKWEEGQRLAKKAEELRTQARDINALVPQYQHAGTVAGALAAQAANPAFAAPPHILPPPPPDPMASWSGPDPMAQFHRSP